MRQEEDEVEAKAEAGPSRHAVVFIFITLLIDNMGVGLILPVMPDLVAELTGGSYGQAALWGGYLTFSFALMQFLFQPVVGNLSDRFGRRPILIVSLIVLTVDYVIMGLAPTITVLFVGRVIAGIASSNHSTASAFMADISPPEKRAQNFGLLGAAFGLGFILGPAIGGLVGEISTRAPFYAAAGLAFINLIYGYFVLPETLGRENRRAFSWRRANPLGTALQILKLPTVKWLLLTFFLFNLAHFVYPAIWAYFSKEAFSWSSTEVGISLALVGFGFALVQGVLMRRLVPWLGEVKLTAIGFTTSVIGLLAISFVTEGWMVYALIPLMVIGGVLNPALTGLMSNQVSNDQQGELQGAISSLSAITMLITPLVATQLFGYFTEAVEGRPYFPGAPFLASGLLMMLALLPFIIGIRRSR